MKQTLLESTILSGVWLCATPWTAAHWGCPRNFPGKNTGTGCHFLLQGICLTQRLNPRLLSLLHWRADSLSLHHQGNHLERYCGYHQFAEADLEINQLAPNHTVVEGQSQGSHPAWPMKGQTSWLLRWIPLPRQAHSTLGPSGYLEKVVFIMGFPGGSDGKESAICLLLFSPLTSYSVSTLRSHTEPFILLSHVRILQIFGNRSLFHSEHG